MYRACISATDQPVWQNYNRTGMNLTSIVLGCSCAQAADALAAALARACKAEGERAEARASLDRVK